MQEKYKLLRLRPSETQNTQVTPSTWPLQKYELAHKPKHNRYCFLKGCAERFFVKFRAADEERLQKFSIKICFESQQSKLEKY